MVDKIVARNGDLVLYAVDDEDGYVVNTADSKSYEPHSIISILSRGTWVIEPNIDTAKASVKLKGGAGSGHFGHAGRPGEVGGSVPGKYISGQEIGAGGTEELPQEMLTVKQYLEEFDIEEFNAADLARYDEMYQDERAVNYLNMGVKDDKFLGYHNFPYRKATNGEREAAKLMSINEVAEEADVSPEDVNEFIAQWADNSGDEDMRSLSIQAAVAEEFADEGVTLSEYQQRSYDFVQKQYAATLELDPFMESMDEELGKDWIDDKVKLDMASELWKERHPDWRPLNRFLYADADANLESLEPILDRATERKIARAMYNVTQRKLLAEIPNSTPDTEIVLHRGMNVDQWTPAGSVADYEGNAIESWSASPGIAFNFGDTQLSVKVKIKDIFSTPYSGSGCLIEGEYILFGSRLDKVYVWNNQDEYDDN